MSSLGSCEAVNKQTSLVFKINVQENVNTLEEDNRKCRVLQKTVETNNMRQGALSTCTVLDSKELYIFIKFRDRIF